jgi:hypothetical protein
MHFLTGKFKESVYMEQPPGFVHPDKKSAKETILSRKGSKLTEAEGSEFG